MTDTLRIGTLGAAKITPMALVRPAREIDGVEVAAVAARDESRAKAFAAKHGIERVHANYAALLSDPEIDAIYNPLPNSHHAEWTVRAIEAGKHVLCEKPFTSNATEAAHVHEIAEKSPKVVMEAFHYRYHPLAQRMRDVVASGELGEPTRIETWVCVPIPFPSDIRFRLDLAGGATMDTGCYAVHFARTLAGEEPEVLSAQAKLRSEGVDRWMRAEVAFPSGATGQITCALWSSTPIKFAARVEFENGELRVTNPLAPQFFHRFRWRRSGEKWNKETFPKKATYTYQLEAFHAAVTQGKPFLTTTADAIKNMQVIDAIYRAAGMQPRGKQ